MSLSIIIIILKFVLLDPDVIYNRNFYKSVNIDHYMQSCGKASLCILELKTNAHNYNQLLNGDRQ